MTGKSDRLIDLMISYNPDGIGVDQEANLEKCVEVVPENMPISAMGGGYNILAEAVPEQVAKIVGETLDTGVTWVSPPADIYPPAKLENIEAFVHAVRTHPA